MFQKIERYFTKYPNVKLIKVNQVTLELQKLKENDFYDYYTKFVFTYI